MLEMLVLLVVLGVVLCLLVAIWHAIVVHRHGKSATLTFEGKSAPEWSRDLGRERCSYAALEAMTRALDDAEANARIVALQALSMADARALPADVLLPRMLKSLRELFPAIRMNALVILGKFGSVAESAVPTIISEIEDPRSCQSLSFVALAVRTLGEIELASEPVMFLLDRLRREGVNALDYHGNFPEEILRQRDREIRRAAKYATKRLAKIKKAKTPPKTPPDPNRGAGASAGR